MKTTFSIHFLQDSGLSGAQGTISIGNFSEKFDSSLSYWSKERYVLQRKDGLYRIAQGHQKSCLITNIHPPDTANFFEWWTIYRIDSAIIFHNALLFLDKLEEAFNIARLYTYIPTYTSTSENGEPISEWKTTEDALRSFLS